MADHYPSRGDGVDGGHRDCVHGHDHADDDGSLEMILVIVFACSNRLNASIVHLRLLGRFDGDVPCRECHMWSYCVTSSSMSLVESYFSMGTVA